MERNSHSAEARRLSKEQGAVLLLSPLSCAPWRLTTRSIQVGKEPGFVLRTQVGGIPTAWSATFTHRSSSSTAAPISRTIGFQSEMDALPQLGHACGHNLIAMSGVAVALAIKAALEAHDVSGTIVLLGTPAEEAGGGKIQLLERGGYADMDAEDLEDLIPILDAAQLSALSRHERDLGDRPAFRTLLDNALRG